MPGAPVMHPSQSPYPHLLHPSMFYPHHPNPFGSPYGPYGPGYPPGFPYMKPGSPLDNPMLHGHPTSIPPPRPEDAQVHGNASEKKVNPLSKPTPTTPTLPPSASSSHSANNKPPSGHPSGNSSLNSSGPSPGAPGYPPHQPYPPQSHNMYIDSPLSSKTSHMDALRAHAHAASAGHHPHHSSPHGPPQSHSLHTSEPIHIDTLDIEPDPEPPSPVHLDRGPSPEAKPDDTECHRSQSAM
jgi:arginine-glutamic acid dipeptide repeat-containing protein